MEQSAHAYLLRGLVGDHLDLYGSNAHFQQSIDGLANSLPLWVNAIAEQSIKSDEEIKEMIKAAEKGPSKLVLNFDVKPHPQPRLAIVVEHGSETQQLIIEPNRFRVTRYDRIVLTRPYKLGAGFGQQKIVVKTGTPDGRVPEVADDEIDLGYVCVRYATTAIFPADICRPE